MAVLVSACSGGVVTAGDGGSSNGPSGGSSGGAQATSNGDGAYQGSLFGGPGSGICTQVAYPSLCASCLALPGTCEVCSNGETECAHYVVRNGACAVETCPPGSQGLGDAGEDSDGAPEVTSDASSRVTGTCTEAEQGLVTVTSLAQVDALLVGRWVRCSSTPAGVTITHSPDEVGIEFAADGTWYTLTQTDGGPLVRSTAGSLTEQGTWSVIADSTSATGVINPQINIDFGSGGFLPWSPTFSVTPTEFSAVSDPGRIVYVAAP